MSNIMELAVKLPKRNIQSMVLKKSPILQLLTQVKWPKNIVSKFHFPCIAEGLNVWENFESYFLSLVQFWDGKIGENQECLGRAQAICLAPLVNLPPILPKYKG